MDRAPREAVVAFALIALAVAGVVKLALWLPGAIERAPARATGKAFQIPQEEQEDHPDPVKVLAETRSALATAETVTIHWLLFSNIDETIPADLRERPRFHGYPVLGSTVVKSKPGRQEVLASVLSQVDPDPGHLTMCFEPQHGIEVKLVDGRSIDLVICYHCYQMWIFNGSDPEGAAVSLGNASMPVLNEQLKADGVEFVDKLEQLLQSLRENDRS